MAEKNSRFMAKDNVGYLIIMLIFQLTIIFVVPFLPDISIAARLEAIVVMTCAMLGMTGGKLIATIKEKSRKQSK